MSKPNAVLSGLRDALSVRQVFGEVVESNGAAVIPAARILGGGGAGGGTGPDAGVAGDGGGLGLRAHPVGAFAIRNGRVRWVPAVDVNRLVLVIAVLVLGVLVIRQARSRARERRAVEG